MEQTEGVRTTGTSVKPAKQTLQLGASIDPDSRIFHNNLEPTVPWVHHGEMNERDQAQLRQQVRELKLRHHDLDCAIRALAERPVVDQLQLARLKKEKLSLKDRIARLQSRLIPDLNA